MPNYNVNSVMQFGRLVEFGQGLKTELDAMKLVSASALKSVHVSGNTIGFYTSTDHSGTAAFTVDFPTELYLDQLKTSFVPSFAFNAETYAGATNPSLEGKPVLVLAVKDTNQGGTPAYTYSFLNMETLIDVYTIKTGDSAKVLSINSATNEIEIKISSVANNAITVQNDGLHVDISGKVDKVQNATAGNLAVMTAAGGISDSGHTFATTANVNELLSEMFPSSNSSNSGD